VIADSGKMATEDISCFCIVINISYLCPGNSFCAALGFCLIIHYLTKISFFLD
jgi:hypothetical protein